MKYKDAYWIYWSILTCAFYGLVQLRKFMHLLLQATKTEWRQSRYQCLHFGNRYHGL